MIFFCRIRAVEIKHDNIYHDSVIDCMGLNAYGFRIEIKFFGEFQPCGKVNLEKSRSVVVVGTLTVLMTNLEIKTKNVSRNTLVFGTEYIRNIILLRTKIIR